MSLPEPLKSHLSQGCPHRLKWAPTVGSPRVMYTPSTLKRIPGGSLRKGLCTECWAFPVSFQLSRYMAIKIKIWSANGHKNETKMLPMRSWTIHPTVDLQIELHAPSVVGSPFEISWSWFSTQPLFMHNSQYGYGASKVHMPTVTLCLLYNNKKTAQRTIWKHAPTKTTTGIMEKCPPNPKETEREKVKGKRS